MNRREIFSALRKALSLPGLETTDHRGALRTTALQKSCLTARLRMEPKALFPTGYSHEVAGRFVL